MLRIRLRRTGARKRPSYRRIEVGTLCTCVHAAVRASGCGDADPLAAGGALLEQLGQRYRDAGVADVTVKLYPAARHEILNETNRDEVTGDVVGWLRKRVGAL